MSANPEPAKQLSSPKLNSQNALSTLFDLLILLIGIRVIGNSLEQVLRESFSTSMYFLIIASTILLTLMLRLWIGNIVIVAILAIALATESMSPGPSNSLLIDVFVAMSVLFLMMSTCRLADRPRYLRPRLSELLSKTYRWLSQFLNDDQNAHLWPNWKALSLLLKHFEGSLIRAALATGVAGVILAMYPEYDRSVEELRLTPTGMRAIVIGVIIAAVVFMASIAVWAIGWYRMSPAQARIYMRSQMVTSMYTELFSILKRRQKSKPRPQ